MHIHVCILQSIFINQNVFYLSFTTLCIKHLDTKSLQHKPHLSSNEHTEKHSQVCSHHITVGVPLVLEQTAVTEQTVSTQGKNRFTTRNQFTWKLLSAALVQFLSSHSWCKNDLDCIKLFASVVQGPIKHCIFIKLQPSRLSIHPPLL